MVNGYEHPDGWGEVSGKDKEHIELFERRHNAKNTSTNDGELKIHPMLRENNDDENDTGDENSEINSTTSRYGDAVREYAMWLDREKGKTLFEAEYHDFDDHLQDLVDNGYSSGVFRVRWSGISQFYQIWNEYADRPSVDIQVPDNPKDHIDVTDYALDKGKSKKAVALDDSDGIYYLDPEEIHQLVENVPKPKLRNELIIKLCFSTGIRRAEATAIKIDHIDQKECSIEIPAQKSDDRTVYYPDSLNILINQWLNVNRNAYTKSEGSEYLFVTKTKGQLNPSNLNDMVKKSAEKAGLQETLYTDSIGREHKLITSHVLRHSYAVQSLLNGTDIETLRESLGHSDLSTTQKYLKIAKDKRGEILRSKGAGTSLAQFQD